MNDPKATETPCQHWNKGPLPPDTWGWGAVVLKGDNPQGIKPNYTGFRFADFCGDHVKLVGLEYEPTAKPEDILAWNNSLTLPPG